MSTWQLGPVLRSIRGHRAAATLVAVQLGIGIAITVLAVVIGDYFVDRNTAAFGSAEHELSFVEVQQLRGDAHGVLATIQGTPDCAGAVVVAGLPLHALERDTDDVRRAVGTPSIAAYELDAGASFMAASGLQLRAGRDFASADLAASPTAAIVSAELAAALWPGTNPIGERFQSRTHGEAIVVGVAAPVNSYLLGNAAMAVVYARVDAHAAHTVVLVRNLPGRAEALRGALRERLRAPGQHAVVLDAITHVQSRLGSVGSVLGILGTIVGTIVLVIFIGSMGLTYFLVTQRTREIGVRRALGATRRDVVRFFVVENIILSIAGAVIGLAVLALVLPAVFYEQEDFILDGSLVAASIVAVLSLNLLATLIPARKAATVPPVTASQSE